MEKSRNKIRPTSLLFIRTPRELVSPLVSPTVRFSFDDVEWKPVKSSLKKPGMKNGNSTPSKEKRVRFNHNSSLMFYPVSHLYQGGVLITPDNKITRRGMFLILVISMCCLASGSLAFSGGLVLLAAGLFILCLVLVLTVAVLILSEIFNTRNIIEVRKQKLGP